MEFLLINHPLDCPVCDKGGECPLQNQAMSQRPRASPGSTDVKRTFPKPINISAQVLLDRERCVLCARCTRFSEQIAGDPFIDAARARRAAAGRHLRGGAVRVLLLRQHHPDLPGRRADRRGLPLPVPAVRPGLDARRRASTARPAARMRTDHRRGKVMRRLAGDDPEVNEEWNCDKGRLAFRYATRARPAHHAAGPRRGRRAASRRPGPRRSAVAAAGLAAAATARRRRARRWPAHRRGRLRLRASSPGSRCGTNDIDFRARPHSAEEADVPRPPHVAGHGPWTSPTPTSRRPRPCCSSGFEPEEESPIVFLRLRKAARKHGTPVCVGRAVRHPRPATRWAAR